MQKEIIRVSKSNLIEFNIDDPIAEVLKIMNLEGIN